MKINNKILIILFVSQNLFIAFPLYFYQFKSTNLNQNTIFLENLKNDELPRSSTNWIISHKIHINNNWTETNSTYDWCNGSGTLNDPFIIENVTIDDQLIIYEDAFITIENSKVFFILRNCYLPNVMGDLFYGMFLSNVSNGIIHNNTISLNYHGIYLTNCSYITASENSLYENAYGIYSSDSHFISFWSNKIIDSIFFGIYSRLSSFFNVSDNLIRNNYIYPISQGFDRYVAIYGYIITQNFINNNSIENVNEILEGIILIASPNNTVSNNTVIKSKYGINLEYTDSNDILNNKINNCVWGIILNGDRNNLSGNQMYDCGILINYLNPYSQFIDITNLANNKPIYYYENIDSLNSDNFLNAGQVILMNCNNTIISKIDVSHSSIGIYLNNCSSSSISNIDSSYNIYGLFSRESQNMEMKECSFIRNENHGISISYGENMMIINNQINYNFDDGINVYRTEMVILINNDIKNNNNDGICLDRCEEAFISYNTITKNRIRGIYLNHVENSSFNSNNVKENDYFGLQLAYSKNAVIKNNYFYNNLNGIQLTYESNNNTVIQNVFLNNEVCFLQDESCENNFYKDNLCVNTQISTINIVIFLIPISILLLLAWIFREKRP
ncbi:MAG: right-handed parallel beta-helix repeat-containing protein [Candidatus Thorarchaeota archaeon]